jgi:hypothetical protein
VFSAIQLNKTASENQNQAKRIWLEWGFWEIWGGKEGEFVHL